jgi:acyl dehydratase
VADDSAPQISEGTITEEALERLRSRLGSYNRPSFYGLGPLHEAATRDGIRHFVRGIGDPNPLWVDREYASKTRWGGIIAPPTFLYSVYWTSGRTGGLPGVHGFHAGNDWVWHRPIFENDQLTVQEQFTGLDEREGEFAGRVMIQSSISTYRNQRGDIVAECKGWQFRAERRAARERGKYQRDPYKYTEGELFAIEEHMLNEEIRGAMPRFWEDVEIGEEVPAVVKGPLSLGDIAAFEAGCIGGMAHVFAVREHRRHPAFWYRDPQTGALEAVIRVHAASDTAVQAGLPMAFDYGSQRMCWLAHPLTNWMGDDGTLKRLYGEVRRFNYLGDTTWIKAKVTDKQVNNGEHLVDLEVWTENQVDEVTAKGHAQISLPTKAPNWESF